MSTDVRFFGGVDWASETHQVCLVAADDGAHSSSKTI